MPFLPLASAPVLHALQLYLLHEPAYSRDAWVAVQLDDGSHEEARLHPHVAIEYVDVLASAMLVPKLWANTAAPVCRIQKLDHPDRVSQRNFNGAIRRQAICQDYLPAQGSHGH